jgi:hypothetical protein
LSSRRLIRPPFFSQNCLFWRYSTFSMVSLTFGSTICPALLSSRFIFEYMCDFNHNVNLLRFLIFARHLVSLPQPTDGFNQSSLRKHSLPGIFISRFHLRASPFNLSKRCRHARAARSAHRRLTGPSLRVASSRHGFGEAISLLYAGPPTLRRREQEESMNRAILRLP